MEWADLAAYAQAAEQLGVDSIWSPEGWGFDGATPLAFLAGKTSTIKLGTGILQIGARTPANLAMTALSLQSISGGRFMLGIGTSGPQVIEGLHGIAFDHPVHRTRETIEILRKAFKGERLVYEGKHFQLPVREGEGKAMRLSAPPADVPIYIAAMGPANLRLTGEVADGWRGIYVMPEEAKVSIKRIEEGAAKVGRSIGQLELNSGGTVWFTEEPDIAIEELSARLAFTLGGMGSKQNNFYNNSYSRAGFAEQAKEIQRLWLEGKHAEARALVPRELAAKTHLVGTDEMVKDRIRAYRDAGFDTLNVAPRQGSRPPSDLGLSDRISLLERVMDLVGQVNAEPKGTIDRC